MAKSHQKEEKLKPLMRDLPPGYLVDAAWLVARNIDRKSIYNYVQYGWIEKIARGVYRRPSNDLFATFADDDWQKVVLSLQYLMEWKCHVGGKTALELGGYEHYLTFRSVRSVYLYGEVPNWINWIPNAEQFILRKSNLFGQSITGLTGLAKQASLDKEDEKTQLALIQSEPERAILEWINEIPDHETFHSIDKVFESLVSLRPKLLTQLLTQCKNVKVKRLFFVFADRHNHTWRKYLESDQFDLGAGPRSLIKGGSIHPHYKISVPKEFISDDEERNDEP